MITIKKAIEILERWYAGGYATQIDDLNPAVKLGIEAIKRELHWREIGDTIEPQLLPGETTD